MTKTKAGSKVRVWEKTRARNEALDVRVYALSAFINLNANLAQVRANIQSQKDEKRGEEETAKKENKRVKRNSFVSSWKT